MSKLKDMNNNKALDIMQRILEMKDKESFLFTDFVKATAMQAAMFEKINPELWELSLRMAKIELAKIDL